MKISKTRTFFLDFLDFQKCYLEIFYFSEKSENFLKFIQKREYCQTHLTVKNTGPVASKPRQVLVLKEGSLRYLMLWVLYLLSDKAMTFLVDGTIPVNQKCHGFITQKV